MTPAEMLKGAMEALPGGQFAQAWTCVEEIDAALNKAGPTALLALKYTIAAHEENTAKLIGMQQARIAHLEQDCRNNAVDTVTFTHLKAAYEKTFKRLARLKKKTSKR